MIKVVSKLAVAVVVVMIMALPTIAQTWNVGVGADSANVTATLSDGTLTISGSGAMRSFNTGFQRPWHNSRNSITNVVIGSGVTTIGSFMAFYGCTDLTSIEVMPDNVRYSSLDGVLFSKAQDTLGIYPHGKQGAYIIPNSVTTIGSSAFSGCTGLTSITIPNSVTTIGDYAFSGCTGLTSVIIPNSVTTIGSSAFEGCTGLTSITAGTSTATLNNGTLTIGGTEGIPSQVYLCLANGVFSELSTISLLLLSLKAA